MPIISRDIRQKSRYLANLERQKESPRAKVGQFFNTLLYGDHAYANPFSGTVDSVQTIELGDVKAFHEQWFSPRNSAVIVTGDIDPKAMAKKLKALFGNWKGEKRVSNVSSTLPVPKETTVLLVNKSTN